MFLSMSFPLLLVAALLSCCTGESLVHGPPGAVPALVGGDVILPCSFNIALNDEFPTVEWSKEGLKPNVVLLYRDGCETYEMKNQAFQYRTSFITKELKNRNISLRISNVQLSDAGKYQCMRLWKNGRRDTTTVELIVYAVPEPKLSLVSVESRGVTLQCEANCWPLEPEIKFLDDQGKNIPADNPKRLQNASGCYSVTRRVTLQEATRVSCRVHQPEINQTRDTDYYSIPVISVDCMGSCLPTIGITVVIILLLLAFCALAAFLWRRYCKSADGQKLPVIRQPSDQSTLSAVSENQPFLQSARFDNMGNDIIEQLQKELDDLKLKLCEKEEIIHKLQNNNNKPQLSPVSCQLDQPTMVCSPAAPTISNPQKSGGLPQNQGPKPDLSRQNSNPAPGHPIRRFQRHHSSPAYFYNAESFSSSLANTSKKKSSDIGRTMSESSAQPGLNVPKLQRRHSSVFPLSHNRYAPLAGLPEDTELLLSSQKQQKH